MLAFLHWDDWSKKLESVQIQMVDNRHIYKENQDRAIYKVEYDL